MESTGPLLTTRFQPGTFDPHSQVVDHGSGEDFAKHKDEGGFGVVPNDQLTQGRTLRKENKPRGNRGQAG